MLNQYSWLIPLLPLTSAILVTCGLWQKRLISAVTSIGAVGFSFLYSLALFVQFLVDKNKAPYEINFPWLQIGTFHFDLGIFFYGIQLLLLTWCIDMHIHMRIMYTVCVYEQQS